MIRRPSTAPTLNGSCHALNNVSWGKSHQPQHDNQSSYGSNGGARLGIAALRDPSKPSSSLSSTVCEAQRISACFDSRDAGRLGFDWAHAGRGEAGARGFPGADRGPLTNRDSREMHNYATGAAPDWRRSRFLPHILGNGESLLGATSPSSSIKHEAYP
ncbi:hypothetical protein FZEAL_5278 [Fusarium zealandicum]|uniref:Uncharacterized protein n=1 Tax=Fusarium zealandicum TaxID=1053134 RepID=A0A8H4UKQ4_9HYPO|nr:hypothetical protein FZEAL_5278 [Fusarium zealandicum]